MLKEKPRPEKELPTFNEATEGRCPPPLWLAVLFCLSGIFMVASIVKCSAIEYIGYLRLKSTMFSDISDGNG